MDTGYSLGVWSSADFLRWVPAFRHSRTTRWSTYDQYCGGVWGTGKGILGGTKYLLVPTGQESLGVRCPLISRGGPPSPRRLFYFVSPPVLLVQSRVRSHRSFGNSGLLPVPSRWVRVHRDVSVSPNLRPWGYLPGEPKRYRRPHPVGPVLPLLYTDLSSQGLRWHPNLWTSHSS